MNRTIAVFLLAAVAAIAAEGRRVFSQCCSAALKTRSLPVQFAAVATGVVIALARGTDGAVINYMTEDRYLTSTAGDGTSVTSAAPDFGPWAGTADAFDASDSSNFVGATQQSTLNANGVTASGALDVWYFDSPGFDPAGVAVMGIDIDFTLPIAVSYVSTYDVSLLFGGFATVGRTAPSSTTLPVNAISSLDGLQIYDLNSSGTLPAGEFQLSILLQLDPSQIYGQGRPVENDYAYSLTVVPVPEPSSIVLGLFATAGLTFVAGRKRLRIPRGKRP